VETDPTRMCELLVGLPEVVVLGIVDVPGESISIFVECCGERPVCTECGSDPVVKDRPEVHLVDLPIFGRSSRLVWKKYRWSCPNPTCDVGSWTESDDRIASSRVAMTSRGGRWATEQVGRLGRTVNEIATELGCDWHTVNDAVISYGEALVDDPGRFGNVKALGLDEVLFARIGPWHTKAFSTSIVDVMASQLLDIVPGRRAVEPIGWLERRPQLWRDEISWGTLDLSGPYRSVFDYMLPQATQVADPFHVVKLANTKLDECRRRVQNETIGHRGHKDDPLYRCRRLLTKADERLDEKGRTKLLGLLRAGDPRGDVTTAWHAKEALRELYSHTNAALAHEWINRLIGDMVDSDNPTEVRSLGRTLRRWKQQIIAWHTAQVSNGPTEAMNNLIKRVKRVAFGFKSFRNYRIRALLYAGKPRWELLATIKPR
jgi:transposase